MTQRDLKEFAEGLVDEDERDEDGEDLLGEAWNESHQEAALHGHNDDHNHNQPHAHPGAAHNVFNVVGRAELEWKKTEEIYDYSCLSWDSADRFSTAEIDTVLKTLCQ